LIDPAAAARNLSSFLISRSGEQWARAARQSRRQWRSQTASRLSVLDSRTPVAAAKTLIKLLGSALILGGAGLQIAGREERIASFMLAAGALLWLALLIAQWWAGNRKGR
jgi:hypothetical protein